MNDAVFPKAGTDGIAFNPQLSGDGFRRMSKWLPEAAPAKLNLCVCGCLKARNFKG